MQLMRTNVVFSRITLVSSFCAEIQLSGKILENMPIFIFHPKTHGARRRSREDPRGGPHLAQARGRLGRAWGWCGRIRAPLDLSFGLHISRNLKTSAGSTFSREEFRFAARERDSVLATRNSVLAPCRDGELEEIITIIMTNASPSTIHDFPIHL